MASATRLIGPEYVMMDGTVLVAEVIGNRLLGHCLDIMLKDMIEHKDMVAGLDITWTQSIDAVLITICTRIGCILVWFSRGRHHLSMEHFLDNKEITFFGVHMKEDVTRLRKRISLRIRNIVDVSDLAADVLHQPRLRALCVRRLASEVLWLPIETRSFAETRIDWAECDLNSDQIESVTTYAYGAYKIGKKLLGL